MPGLCGGVTGLGGVTIGAELGEAPTGAELVEAPTGAGVGVPDENIDAALL